MELWFFAILATGVIALTAWATACSILNAQEEERVPHYLLQHYIEQVDPALDKELAELELRDAYAVLAERLDLKPRPRDYELLSGVRERLYDRAHEVYDSI